MGLVGWGLNPVFFPILSGDVLIPKQAVQAVIPLGKVPLLSNVRPGANKDDALPRLRNTIVSSIDEFLADTVFWWSVLALR